MHQNPPRHAFTPVLHQSSSILPNPALMGPQDRNFNTNLPGQTARTFFAPITASHRPTTRSSNSTIRGRWGALHVCIAWKIYHHKQLKKLQQMHSSQQELTPERPASSPSASVQQKELHQPCAQPCSGGSKSETTSCDCSVSDLQTPPSVSTHSRANREKLDCEKQDQHSTPDKKENHQIHQSSPTKDLPHKEKFGESIVTSDLDGRHSGSLDRKRQFECEGINKAKRMRHEMFNSPFGSSQTLQYYPSPFIATYTHPPAHNMQVQHTNMSDCSFLYPNSIRFNASYPGTKPHPCQTSSWETMRDTHTFHFRKHTLKDYSLNTCKAIRKPLVARGITSPLYFLRVRETLLSREVSTPLQTPAASYWL